MKKALTILTIILTTSLYGQVEQRANPLDFLPKGYVVYEEIYGDLNKDGTEDCVLIIQGTDKSKFKIDEDREHLGELNMNRIGIIVLFNKNGLYELALKNYDCFSSEYEYTSIYGLELYVEIKKGNLHIGYMNGTNGNWKYTFRYQNSDFELIGYDENSKSSIISEFIIFDETSINFSTKKKLNRKVIGVSDNGKGNYKETWSNINVKKLIKLSEIEDFGEFNQSMEHFGI